MSKWTVQTLLGTCYHITDGLIDEEFRKLFSEGGCFVFATVLNELYHYKIFKVIVKLLKKQYFYSINGSETLYKPGDWLTVHAVVQVGNDEYVDSFGKRTKNQLLLSLSKNDLHDQIEMVESDGFADVMVTVLEDSKEKLKSLKEIARSVLQSSL